MTALGKDTQNSRRPRSKIFARPRGRRHQSDVPVSALRSGALQQSPPPLTAARRLVGIVATNSPDFFDRFHQLITDEASVVLLRSTEDTARIAATGVTEIVVPRSGFGWTSWTGALPEEDALAQIAFTSGTQGEPKGVLLTLANLADTAARLSGALGLDSSARIYLGAPIYHSFGAGLCRAAASVGGASYVPPNGANPREIAAMLQRGEINAIATVPTVWRHILQHREMYRGTGHRVRWILIGSQPMSRDEKLLLREVFPQARILHHYGLTEASSSTFLDVSEAPEALLESAGRPLYGVEVRITPEGRIAIRGPHVARQLLVGGSLVPNIDREGWFVTNDAGEIRDGTLYFLGRLDDVINAGGLKVSADAIEARIVSELGLDRQISVVRIPDRDRGDGVLLAVTEECASPDADILAAAVGALRESGLDAASALKIMRVPELPRTETDKVQRAALARRYADQAPAAEEPAVRPGDAPVTLRAAFEDTFPGKTVRDTDSFVSLGGDSLNFVALSIAIEDQLGHLPEGWQSLSIAELEATRPHARWMRMTDTTLVLRFVGIVSIVYYHFMPMGFGGATFLLMMAVGYNFSRFQLSRVLSLDSAMPVVVSTFRIALPLLLLVCVIELRKGVLDPLTLLLLGNFQPAAERTLEYWFVEVTVQTLLLMALLLAVAPVRRLARAYPLAFAWGLTFAALVAEKVGPLVWDTLPYFHRMPHMLLWLFALGMLLERSRTMATRLAASVVVLALPPIIWGTGPQPHWIAHASAWVWVGGLILVWFDTIPLPAPISRTAFYVGGASMFIYITHFSVQQIWHRLVPGQPELLAVVVALAVGTVIWLAWDGLQAVTGRLRYRLRL